MRDFAALFSGRDDVHGWYGNVAGSSPSDRGKKTATATTKRESVTEALFSSHLRGEQRLGIVPIREDGTVGWFCIDIDFYTLPGMHPAIAKAIGDCGLSLVQTRTKSGGAHLWMFFERPVKAIIAIGLAQDCIEKLHLMELLVSLGGGEPEKHVEIFPKQSMIKSQDFGSWVNLPYFGDLCHCVGENGEQDLTLEQFIEYANARIFSGEIRKASKKEKLSQAPPCIDTMREQGVEEGNRNNALVQFALYANQAFPDTAREETEKFNETSIHPPLTQDEVAAAYKSAAGGGYRYLCNRFVPICQRDECMKRKFGINGGGTSEDFIDHIEKLDGEDPIYIITITGIKFAVKGDELFSFALFRKRAMLNLNRILPTLKQDKWEEYLNNLLSGMDISTVSDTQMRDRVIVHFHNWIKQTCGDKQDGVLRRMSYYDEGRKSIFFRGDDFMALIDRQLRLPRNDVWIYMRDAGTVQDTVEFDEHKVKVWRYPVSGPLWFEPQKGRQK